MHDRLTPTVARLTSALTVGGLFVTAVLVTVLPGGPGSERPILRWMLTLIGAAFVVALVLLAMRMSLRWRVATVSVRVLGALAVCAGGVFAWTLTTLWIPVSWRSSDGGMAEVVARLRDAGVSVQSTLVVYDSLGGSARVDMLDDPAIAFLLPRTRELWAAQVRSGPPGYNLPAFTRRLTSALHRAGVRVVAGTDAMGTELIVPGFSMHRELQLLRAAGLTPYEAIFAARRAPAAFLKRSNEFGTIAVGQRADFLLIAGNPLDDLGRLARPTGVMARGRWFAREQLQAILDTLRR
jgi:hypothetical protein